MLFLASRKIKMQISHMFQEKLNLSLIYLSESHFASFYIYLNKSHIYLFVYLFKNIQILISKIYQKQQQTFQLLNLSHELM